MITEQQLLNTGIRRTPTAIINTDRHSNLCNNITGMPLHRVIRPLVGSHQRLLLPFFQGSINIHSPSRQAMRYLHIRTILRMAQLPQDSYHPSHILILKAPLQAPLMALLMVPFMVPPKAPVNVQRMVPPPIKLRCRRHSRLRAVLRRLQAC